MTKHLPKIVAASALLLLLAACAAGGPEARQAASGGPLSLFLLGLWHGIIAPVTLLVELAHRFLPSVVPWTIRMYEPGDPSVLYDLGFYLGLAGGPSIVVRRWG